MPMPPENPEGFDKINYVIDSWANACEAPWYIYIETLKPAALEAFIVLITFGWADVIRGRFRPKGLGRRTTKRKGKWNKRIPAFPEFGNTIGKMLPFAEQIEDFVHYNSGAKNLWRIDNAMQAGLFFWLVADVAEDFAFNWTSLLYKTHWCQQSHLGRFSYHNTTFPIKSAGSWHKHGFGVKDYEKAPLAWVLSSGWSGPTGCDVGTAIRFEVAPPFDPPTSTRVRIIEKPGAKVIWESDDIIPDADGKSAVVLTGGIPPNQAFEVRTWHEPTWCKVGLGSINAVQT